MGPARTFGLLIPIVLGTLSGAVAIHLKRKRRCRHRYAQKPVPQGNLLEDVFSDNSIPAVASVTTCSAFSLANSSETELFGGPETSWVLIDPRNIASLFQTDATSLAQRFPHLHTVSLGAIALPAGTSSTSARKQARLEEKRFAEVFVPRLFRQHIQHTCTLHTLDLASCPSDYLFTQPQDLSCTLLFLPPSLCCLHLAASHLDTWGLSAAASCLHLFSRRQPGTWLHIHGGLTVTPKNMCHLMRFPGHKVKQLSLDLVGSCAEVDPDVLTDSLATLTVIQTLSLNLLWTVCHSANTIPPVLPSPASPAHSGSFVTPKLDCDTVVSENKHLRRSSDGLPAASTATSHPGVAASQHQPHVSSRSFNTLQPHISSLLLHSISKLSTGGVQGSASITETTGSHLLQPIRVRSPLPPSKESVPYADKQDIEDTVSALTSSETFRRHSFSRRSSLASSSQLDPFLPPSITPARLLDAMLKGLREARSLKRLKIGGWHGILTAQQLRRLLRHESLCSLSIWQLRLSAAELDSASWMFPAADSELADQLPAAPFPDETTSCSCLPVTRSVLGISAVVPRNGISTSQSSSSRFGGQAGKHLRDITHSQQTVANPIQRSPVCKTESHKPAGCSCGRDQKTLCISPHGTKLAELACDAGGTTHTSGHKPLQQLHRVTVSQLELQPSKLISSEAYSKLHQHARSRARKWLRSFFLHPCILRLRHVKTVKLPASSGFATQLPSCIRRATSIAHAESSMSGGQQTAGGLLLAQCISPLEPCQSCSPPSQPMLTDAGLNSRVVEGSVLPDHASTHGSDVGHQDLGDCSSNRGQGGSCADHAHMSSTAEVVQHSKQKCTKQVQWQDVTLQAPVTCTLASHPPKV